VTTLSDEACKQKVREQLESILTGEGEMPVIANRLAVNTTTVLATGALGPRPFGVASPSGADYSFFVSAKVRNASCVSMAVKRGSPDTPII
jgi:hypothetical protein